jgi:P pilus assembly chaperone PapD
MNSGSNKSRAVLICVSLAAAAVTAAGAGASVATGHTTKVRTLHAFSHRLHSVRTADLPASVAEVVAEMGADASTAQRPISSSPAVYVVHRGSQLCTIISVVHAGGSCDSVLRDAGGEARFGLSIVDGKMFGGGLVANDVRSLRVALSATPSSSAAAAAATIANNLFVVSLPYHGGIVPSATVTVTRADGSSVSFQVTGVPGP